MADIAELGFSVDTGQLAQAKVSLEALAPAATKAETATEKLEKQFTDTATAADRAAQGARGVGAALATATNGARTNGAAVAAAAAANRNSASASNEAAAAMQRQGAAATAAAGQIRAATAAANDNFGAMRHNTGNIAAQFQDIGVTAAMGMSPLMIALQQGTQLSAVFAQSTGGAMKSLAAAFGSVLNPTSLLTIAIVGLAAAGLQMVDWVALGKSALNGLASVMETVAPYAVGVAAALALIYAPAIITGIWSVATAFYGLAAGMLATIGLPVLIVAGLTAIIAAANYWRDDLTKMLGFDIVAAAKYGVNFIIGSFVGAFNAIRATWSMLPAAIGDAVISAANITIRTVTKMVNDAHWSIKALINALPGGMAITMGAFALKDAQIANPFAGSRNKVGAMAQSEMSKGRATDYVGKGVAFVEKGGKYLGDKLRGIADGLGVGGKKKTGGKSDTDKAAKGGKSDGEKFTDIVDGVKRDKAAIQADIDGLNLTADAALRLKNEQKLLNEASQKGIKLTDAQRVTLKGLAGELTDLQTKLKNLQGFKEISEGAEKSLAALKSEHDLIGLVGQGLATAKYEQELFNQAKEKGIALDAAQIKLLKEKAIALAAQATVNQHDTFMSDVNKSADEKLRRSQEELSYIGMNADQVARLRLENELLAQARQKNIDLTPADLAALGEIAGEQAAVEAKIRKTRAAMDYAKDATKGFFDDMRSNLKQGQGFWEAFGNSVKNVLDNLIDKLLNEFIDAVIEAAFAASGAGGGASGGGGGAASAIANTIISLFSAKGNVFDNGHLTAYAQGGAFGTVSKPTAFAYGRGELGVMGEAGPEAVLPLQRGSDGSLGVQMFGSGGGESGLTNNNVQVSNHYNLSGALTSNDIIAMNRQSAEQTLNVVKRELMNWVEQHQRDGAVV